MSPEYASALSEILKAMLIAATPIVVALLQKLAKKIEAWIDAQTTNETLKRIEHEALDTVAAVGQSVADPIKEAAADGKLTDEEKQRIKRIALDTLKARVSSVPAALLPDLEKRLSDAVESAVMRLGLAKSAAGLAPAVPQPKPMNLDNVASLPNPLEAASK
jgi:hypothetical protein